MNNVLRRPLSKATSSHSALSSMGLFCDMTENRQSGSSENPHHNPALALYELTEVIIAISQYCNVLDLVSIPDKYKF